MARRNRLLIWTVALVGGGALALWIWPMVRPIFRGGALAAATALEQAGPWGPVAVVGLQVLQAVVSPLPSWPVTMAAGAEYGAVTGTLLSLLGGMLGASVNLLLARHLGQGWVRRTLGDVWIDRAGSLGPLHFLVLSLFGRLIPVASFDVVAYVAGLGKISLPLFLGVAAIGQAPALFAYAYFGQDLTAAGRASLWGSLLVLLFVALILGGKQLWKRLTV